MKKIIRDDRGDIIDECFEDMKKSLPIKVWVNDDEQPHIVLNTIDELEGYFFGALPYCLTTRYESL